MNIDRITNGIRDRRTCIFCMRCVDSCDDNALEVANEVYIGERQANRYVPLCTLERGPGIRH